MYSFEFEVPAFSVRHSSWTTTVIQKAVFRLDLLQMHVFFFLNQYYLKKTKNEKTKQMYKTKDRQWPLVSKEYKCT